MTFDGRHHRFVLFALFAVGLAVCAARCGPAGGAPTAPVIKIGIALSSTGPYAQEGADMRDGYELWAELANARGVMVNGVRHGVELVFRDDASDPATVRTQVEHLVKSDGVRFLFGPYSSELTKAASLEAESLGVNMVEGGGAAEELFERSQAHLFSVIATAGVYPRSALAALHARGARTVAIAYEDSPFPESIRKAVLHWSKSLGMEVVAEASFPKGATDVSGLIPAIKARDPDVFVVGGHAGVALQLVAAAKAQDFCPKAMLVTIGPSNPKIVAQLGRDAEYLLAPTQWHPSMSHRGVDFGTAREYDERFRARYGASASYQAAEASACGLALMHAIERAGSLDSDAVRAALRTLRLETFFGAIEFDETGKNVAKQMGTTQVLGGKIELVAPELQTLVYPMPPWNERK